MMGGDEYDGAGGSVVEPTDKDVLCGRGGMSNHHQGNEWYRRLIRSNRPLYRACPKHTKLLVSKAIVQAVEEQGGRFLERSRKTGMWYQVPYKRAVDKTSQGLRERDKDDASAPKITTLPASLRAGNGGKIPKPNLSHLAQVTMAHAGMPINNNPKHPTSAMPNLGSGQPSQQSQFQQAKQKQMQQKQMQQKQMQQKQMQQQKQQQMQRQQMQQQQNQQMQRGGGGPFFNNNMAPPSQGGGGPEPLEAPPQPGLLASQSSMFRLLSSFTGGSRSSMAANNRRTSLQNDGSYGPTNPVAPLPSMSGPGVTSFMGFAQSMGGNNMMNSNNANNMGMSNNMGMGMGGMDNNPMSNPMNNPMMNPMNMNNNMNTINNAMGNNFDPTNSNFTMQQQQQFQQMQQQQQQQQQQQNGGAPSLTRFTSQVSDWLGSFWPVGKGPNAAGGPGGPGGGPGPGPGGVHPGSQGVGLPGGPGGDQGIGRGSLIGNNMNNNNNMGQGNSLDDFPRGGNMQNQGGNFPGGGPQSDQMNPMQQNMMAQLGGGPMMENNMGMPAPMAAMGGGGGGGPGRNRARGGDDVGDNTASIPQPAALESSVSTTLLKLASSPSKIFAGISSFFSPDQQSGFQDPNQQDQSQQQRSSFTAGSGGDPLMDAPPPPPGGLGLPVGRRQSRRSSNLLDDYEETELEARMRAVNG